MGPWEFAAYEGLLHVVFGGVGTCGMCMYLDLPLHGESTKRYLYLLVWYCLLGPLTGLLLFLPHLAGLHSEGDMLWRLSASVGQAVMTIYCMGIAYWPFNRTELKLAFGDRRSDRATFYAYHGAIGF